MAKEIIYLTEEGYKKLKDELDHMRSVERPAISAAIAEARDKGDLSENAEYDAAREAQGMLEMRIAKLEATLTNARIIDESKIDKSKGHSRKKEGRSRECGRARRNYRLRDPRHLDLIRHAQPAKPGPSLLKTESRAARPHKKVCRTASVITHSPLTRKQEAMCA